MAKHNIGGPAGRGARPSDPNQLAKWMVEQTAKDSGEPAIEPKKNPAAVALGKLGGRKGGLARAANMSARKRKETARKAALARWAKKDAS